MERPFVSLKLATSLDGKIALANGQSKWITCDEARQKGRELRGAHDAICIGANTAALDNPKLTTRIKGLPDPARIVFDSNLRLSPESHLVQSAKDVPVYCFYDKTLEVIPKSLKDYDINLIGLGRDVQGLDVVAALEALKSADLNSVLVEGGGTLAASFLRLGLVDVIHWFRAPVILGGDGRNCIADMNLMSLDKAPKFRRKSLEIICADSYEILELA